MSLYIAERVKEQKADDQESDKNIVFTCPWILNFPLQNDGQWMDRDSAAEAPMTTSYQMATIHWNICLKNEYNAIVINNENFEEYLKNGSCYISYTLFYDAQMRFEYFSSTRIKMEEHGYREDFCTPDGYMTRFIEAANNKKFSKCVIFVELHLPTKYFYQPPLKRKIFSYGEEISDILPNDFENDFRFDYFKKGDYLFECLDGTVPAHRNMLFTSSATMKKQLRLPRHHSVGIVKYTVAVVKPIIIFFHSHVFKLPESFTLDYIGRLLNAIEFFQPFQKSDMIIKVKEVLGEKFVKEKHDFDSLLHWLSFANKYRNYQFGLFHMVGSLIANEYYYKLQRTFPQNARNADNPLYHQTFGEIEADSFFEYIDCIFAESFVTNVILQ
uniref:BTB domain-containing protein n=1 Tax=Panagrolaimus sp. ES5 TaxID=591445 RepID=A0AC34FVB4_9BILA